jgi:hypothetical protein
MLHRIALVGALSLFVVISACRTTTTPAALEIDRIAIVGHGIAFDRKMRPIAIDLKTIRSMQQSLSATLRSQSAEVPDDRGFIATVERAIAGSQVEEVQTLLYGTLINWRLERAVPRVRDRYRWRNNFLLERVRGLLDERNGGRFNPSDALKRILLDGGVLATVPGDTGYMTECRAARVPVPPNFTMAPGLWANQGNLTSNILRPGKPAAVWTWTDPLQRGACVALPRDDGGGGSFTGIICQSAVTGKACFWDNLTRDDPTRRIPAASETMVISALQDGRTLDEGEACTDCHTGNNVFLMSPDDSTWAKLTRGPLTASNFTTVIEPQMDTTEDGPRYTPVAYDSWVNPPLELGCSGVCHGRPSEKLLKLIKALPAASPLPMPPACAKDPDGPDGLDYRDCYKSP